MNSIEQRGFAFLPFILIFGVIFAGIAGSAAVIKHNLTKPQFEPNEIYEPEAVIWPETTESSEPIIMEQAESAAVVITPPAPVTQPAPTPTQATAPTQQVEPPATGQKSQGQIRFFNIKCDDDKNREFEEGTVLYSTDSNLGFVLQEKVKPECRNPEGFMDEDWFADYWKCCGGTLTTVKAQHYGTEYNISEKTVLIPEGEDFEDFAAVATERFVGGTPRN